jgi:hypothetical protein
MDNLIPKPIFIGKQIKVKIDGAMQTVEFAAEPTLNDFLTYKEIAAQGGGFYFVNGETVIKRKPQFKIVRRDGLAAAVKDTDTAAVNNDFDLDKFKKMSRNEFGILSKSLLRKVAKNINRAELQDNPALLFDAIQLL